MSKNTKGLFPEGMNTDGMVSVSQLQTFMSCPKKWAYNYIDNLKPRVERSYLTVGKLCHTGMQHAMKHKLEFSNTPGYYREHSLDQGLFAMRSEFGEYILADSFLPEEIPDLEQILTDAEAVFTQAWWEFNPDRWDVVSVNGLPALELHFLIPCPGSKGLHGYIDAILRDRTTGDIWCTDYKFRKSLADDAEEAYNIQNAVYCKACEKMGIVITGTMTWQHCNTPAAQPTLNKNGAMSRAKIKTTWEVYERALYSAGLDPKFYYEEMIPKLGEIEWYKETHEYRNALTVQNIWDNVVVPNSYAIKTARTPKAKNRPSMYPWNCKMCQYQSLCQAEFRGYDTEYIKMTEYTLRQRDPSIIAEDDKKLLDENTTDVL